MKIYMIGLEILKDFSWAKVLCVWVVGNMGYIEKS